MTTPNKRKVLLVGWDAADWKVINPLIEKGQMPTLQSLMNRGVHGNIATMDPPLSPMLWTSIATGKMPDKHGILGFTEPVEGGGIRPVTSTSRKAKALWNIFSQEGLTSNVVSWWPSNPAEEIKGNMVSNLFQKVRSQQPEKDDLPENTVYPSSLQQTIADLRIHPSELTEHHIAPFIPEVRKINLENDNRPDSLAKTLAETASVQSATTHLMETTEWDFTAAYFDGIDHFCHSFMKYHAPQQSHISDEDFDFYKHVINSAYRFHDMMLERLIELAGEDCTVILVSDHGFHSDHLRPQLLPNEPAGPAFEHRDFGIFCMAGPGIKQNEKIHGASIIDIAPTVLQLFDLPIGKDMDGKVLATAFEKEIDIKKVDSWENIGPTRTAQQPSTTTDQQSLQQLIELGYIDDPGENKELAATTAQKEANYNLARSFLANNRLQQAKDILKDLTLSFPEELRFHRLYLTCVESLGDHELARKELNSFKSIHSAIPPSISLIEGKLLMTEGKFSEAHEILNELHKAHPHLSGIHMELGKVQIKLRALDKAQLSFNTVLNRDPECANAYYGLGVVELKKDNYEGAIELFLKSTELVFFNPVVHNRLGEALYLAGDEDNALQAFQTALTLAPGMTKAKQWLTKLGIQDESEIDMITRKDGGIIISGLPRSGTSLMMKILQQTGIEILEDDKRPADDSNPKGYFEMEAIKSLHKDNSCLTDLSNKAAKVIAQLVQHIPNNQTYKVLFMERDLDEIIKSQQVMLGRPNVYPIGLQSTYTKQLSDAKNWLKIQPNIEVHYVSYKGLISDPEAQLSGIAKFLNIDLSIDSAKAAIDPKLYRNKQPTWKLKTAS